MKIRYRNNAYFIDPKGSILPVWQSKHIDEICREPEQFGLTLKTVNEKFRKHNEKLGAERKAREEIMTSLLRKGWIRVRFRPSGYLIFQLNKLTSDAKIHMLDFMKEVQLGNILPYGIKNPGVLIFDISNPANVFVKEDSVKEGINALKVA